MVSSIVRDLPEPKSTCWKRSIVSNPVKTWTRSRFCSKCFDFHCVRCDFMANFSFNCFATKLTFRSGLFLWCWHLIWFRLFGWTEKNWFMKISFLFLSTWGCPAIARRKEVNIQNGHSCSERGFEPISAAILIYIAKVTISLVTVTNTFSTRKHYFPPGYEPVTFNFQPSITMHVGFKRSFCGISVGHECAVLLIRSCLAN